MVKLWNTTSIFMSLRDTGHIGKPTIAHGQPPPLAAALSSSPGMRWVSEHSRSSGLAHGIDPYRVEGTHVDRIVVEC